MKVNVHSSIYPPLQCNVSHPPKFSRSLFSLSWSLLFASSAVEPATLHVPQVEDIGSIITVVLF